MKILVIGVTGFIGNALVPMLREDGHEVIEGIRYASGRFSGYGNEGVFFDLRDSKETRDAIAGVKPEVVINLAAQSAVSYSFSHPEEVGEVDYMGVVRVANACVEAGAHLVQASSSEVYGRGGYAYPVSEGVLLGGASPYASAKIAAEDIIRTLAATRGLQFTILRPFNTIARSTVRQKHFVVERAITQAIELGEISLHDPTPRRDFMFRTDHARGYRLVVRALGGGEPRRVQGETFNLCTGDSWSIQEMAWTVAELVGRKTGRAVRVQFSATPDRPLDIPTLHGSHEHITEVLGWRPEYTIEQGLKKAVEEWIDILR